MLPYSALTVNPVDHRPYYGGSKGKGNPGPKSGHSTSDSDSSPSTSAQPSRKPAGERKQQWHSIKSLPARRPNKPPKAPASSENYKPVDGVRRVWGTMRDSSCRTVLGTLQRLTSVAQSIEVRRKFKKVGEKKVRWWFLIRGEESVLECLQTEWANVENSTSWKLEQCYQPATPPTETSEPSEPTSNPDQPTPSNPTAGILPVSQSLILSSLFVVIQVLVRHPIPVLPLSLVPLMRHPLLSLQLMVYRQGRRVLTLTD